MNLIKTIPHKFIKVIIVILITSSLLLFFNQKKFENLYGEYLPEVMSNFIDKVFHISAFSVIRSWFEVDPSNIKVNTQEKMTTYKLELLGKSLNNYFKSLLEETDELISHYNVYQLLRGNSYEPDKPNIKNYFKKYIRNNLDILEVSLYKSDGEKLSSVKYKNIPGYTISKKIIEKLQLQDNIFIKNSVNQNLVLISAIKDRSVPKSSDESSEIIGIISQTINPVFFIKILDFLNINDELFYIKSPDDEYIVDNYSAYQFIQNKGLSFPYLFYQKLSQTKESKLTLNVNEVNFAIGVIVRENNMAGNFVAFICFLLLFYLGFVLVQFAWKHIRLLKTPLTVSNTEIGSDSQGMGFRLTKDDKEKPTSGFRFAKKERPKFNLSFFEEAKKKTEEKNNLYSNSTSLYSSPPSATENKITFENASLRRINDEKQQINDLASSK